MNDDARDELASAYLDGDATDDERRTVEGEPDLLGRVAELRAVAALVSKAPDPAAGAAQARDASIAAALTAFAESRPDAPPSLTAARATGGRHRSAWVRFAPLGAVAVAVIAVLGLVGLDVLSDDDGDGEVTAAATGSTEPLDAVEAQPELDAMADEEAGADAAYSAEDAPLSDSAEGDGAATDDGSAGSDETERAESAPETTAAESDADDDGEAAADSAAAEVVHVCDDTVRAADPDLGVLLRVAEDSADGRDTLVYALADDPDEDRSYLIDPVGCADLEIVTDDR